MPQLDISTFPSQIFWLLICFGILCFAMVTFLAPRLGKSLELRQQELESLKDKAEKLLEEAHSLAHENEITIDNSRKEANAKIQKILSELNQYKDQKLLEFDTKAQGKLQELNKSLHTQRDDILKDADKLISHLSLEIFEKLTGKKLAEVKIKQSLQGIKNKGNE